MFNCFYVVFKVMYCLPSRVHLVILLDLLFPLSNLYTIFSDLLCLSFEIHQMTAVIIQKKTVVINHTFGDSTFPSSIEPDFKSFSFYLNFPFQDLKNPNEHETTALSFTFTIKRNPQFLLQMTQLPSPPKSSSLPPPIQNSTTKLFHLFPPAREQYHDDL
jgi:hypothetical protein